MSMWFQSLSLRLLIRFCSSSCFEGNDNLFLSSSNSFYLYSLCFNNCPKRHIMLDMFESCSNKFMITNKSFMLNIILTFFWKIKKVHLSCFQGNVVLIAYFRRIASCEKTVPNHIWGQLCIETLNHPFCREQGNI